MKITDLFKEGREELNLMQIMQRVQEAGFTMKDYHQALNDGTLKEEVHDFKRYVVNPTPFVRTTKSAKNNKQ